MEIQNLKYPFFHTIIYNFFDEEELKKVLLEIKEIDKLNLNIKTNDVHHKELLLKNNTKSYCLDNIYLEKRNQSSILDLITKIYNLNRKSKLNLEENPFLNYIGVSNSDTTFLQIYQNDSSYFEHQDASVLTFLYVFWEEPKSFEGADLIFTKYDYKPFLQNNCCLIFPSFELHKLSKMVSDGAKRYSINQRIYVLNK